MIKQEASVHARELLLRRAVAFFQEQPGVLVQQIPRLHEAFDLGKSLTANLLQQLVQR